MFFIPRFNAFNVFDFFNVRYNLCADVSQFNLPHGTNNKKEQNNKKNFKNHKPITVRRNAICV